MISADQELFALTVEGADKTNSAIFTQKTDLYVPDENNGAYNGEITINTSSLNTTSKWLSYSQSYLEIPYVLSVKSSTADAAATFNSWYAGLKNGYFSIIDSMSVEYNHTSVQQSHPFINFHVNYKLMTEYDVNDLKKLDSGFYPDSAGSYQYSSTGVKPADGYSNNDDVVTVNDRIRSELINSGFYERRKRNTAHDLTNGLNGSLPIINNASARRIGMNYYEKTGVGADTIASWYIICTVHLKNLSNFIESLPLCKGGEIKLVIKYNSATTTIRQVAEAGGIPNHFSLISHVQNSGNTNVAMFAGVGTGPNTYGPNTAIPGDITISTGVLRNDLISGSSKFPITSTRLCIPAYQMSPKYELQLIQKFSKYSFNYTDLYSFAFNVSENENFNQILSNSIQNMTRLTIMAYPRHTAAHKVFENISISTYQSPFDSSPNTPIISLTDIQVEVAGQAQYPKNIRYDWESFNDEFVKTGDTGSISRSVGLIGAYEWKTSYRFYTFNLERHTDSDALVGKSISVQGVNNSGIPIQIVAFVEYRKI